MDGLRGGSMFMSYPDQYADVDRQGDGQDDEGADALAQAGEILVGGVDHVIDRACRSLILRRRASEKVSRAHSSSWQTRNSPQPQPQEAQ
jgi:hypothetical protein